MTSDLAAAETGEDLDASVGRAHAQGQDALDGLVVLDDIGQEAALARPDGSDRDDRGLPARGHRDRDLGEGAGTKGPVARVVDVGRDVDQARGVVGRLRHMDDLGRELAAVLPDVEGGLLSGLDPGRVALGDPEPEEERIAADERGQDGPGLDILPRLDRARLDDARDGGLDEGVTEIELGLVEGRPGLGDLGGGGEDLGPPGLDLLARG